jgi:hypothetical protein
MLEFLQANWIWLAIGAGVVWFLFRQGGCAMGSHTSHGSESSRTKAASSGEEHGSHVEEEPGHHRTRRAGRGCC